MTIMSQKADRRQKAKKLQQTCATQLIHFCLMRCLWRREQNFGPNDPWLTQKGQKYCFNNKTLGVPQIENNVKDFKNAKVTFGAKVNVDVLYVRIGRARIQEASP